MAFECSMTGKVFSDTADGIYEDGEWVSWGWINGQLHEQELRKKFPKSSPEVAHILEDMISTSKDCFQITGRYLQIWGELGELYSEVKYGIKRHKLDFTRSARQIIMSKTERSKLYEGYQIHG